MAALHSSLESKIDSEVVWKESIDRRCCREAFNDYILNTYFENPKNLILKIKTEESRFNKIRVMLGTQQNVTTFLN